MVNSKKISSDEKIVQISAGEQKKAEEHFQLQ